MNWFQKIKAILYFSPHTAEEIIDQKTDKFPDQEKAQSTPESLSLNEEQLADPIFDDESDDSAMVDNDPFWEELYLELRLNKPAKS